MKVCTKCGIGQLKVNFNRDRSRDDGLFPQCRSCRKIDRHQYYLMHKELICANAKEWRKNNKDASNMISKRYRDNNKEKISLRTLELKTLNPERFKENSRRHYNKHRNAILHRQREYASRTPELQKARRKKYFEENKAKILKRSRQWYAENSDIHNQRVKDWHKRNPEKRLSYVHTRRARRLANGGAYSMNEWNDLKKQCGYACVCCGRKEPSIRLTIDHIVPIAKGGSNDIKNIQPLCMKCNKSKATKTINYIMEENDAQCIESV